MRGWKGKPCSEGQACPAGGKLSQEHERRMRKEAVMKQAWAKQGVGGNGCRHPREGQDCRSAVERTKSTGVTPEFQPSVEQAGDEAAYPPSVCTLSSGAGSGRINRGPRELENSSN